MTSPRPSRTLGCAVALLLASTVASAASDGVPTGSAPAGGAASWRETVASVAARAPELLSRYVRIETANPPGNETEGARFLARVLAAEGIDSRVLESAPGRGNLYARLRGNGAKRAVVLLSHIDTVGADASRWKHPPFAGVIENGIVHGRGTLDCKGIGITQLLTMVALARLGEPLARDVILLATADEESGGGAGVGWLLENHRDLVDDAEFVITEGGSIRRQPGRPLLYELAAAEKGPCWFRVVAAGEPGHASHPAKETAVDRLVSALASLDSWELHYEVGSIVAGYYAAYAELDREHARQLRQLGRSLEDPDFYRWFVGDPTRAALIRDTLTATVLHGSERTNVVPAEASAEVDARLLPAHDCGRFLDAVRKRIGNDHVRVEPGRVAFPATQSSLDNALTRAIERLADVEPGGAVVLPGMLTGFTDAHYFRERGLEAYGFTPLVVTQAERAGVHGPDEQVEVAELEAAVPRMVRLLRELSQQ
jgi:acetylornithine deacetylase/succinyl-diaminopimelate desuccinylase-like protein